MSVPVAPHSYQHLVFSVSWILYQLFVLLHFHQIFCYSMTYSLRIFFKSMLFSLFHMKYPISAKLAILPVLLRKHNSVIVERKENQPLAISLVTHVWVTHNHGCDHRSNWEDSWERFPVGSTLRKKKATVKRARNITGPYWPIFPMKWKPNIQKKRTLKTVFHRSLVKSHCI